MIFPELAFSFLSSLPPLLLTQPAGQAKQVETVEVDKPVVPETVEEKVKEKTGLWQKLTGFFGAGGVGGGRYCGRRAAGWFLGRQILALTRRPYAPLPCFCLCLFE